MGNLIFRKAKRGDSTSSSSSQSKEKKSSKKKKNSDDNIDNNNKNTSAVSSSSKSKKSNKMAAAAAPIIIQPTVKHTASLIFLHGLGDTGHGWAEGFNEIKKPHIKYIFPTAPIRPVTLNAGMRMTAWFDIIDLGPNAKQDEEGLKQSSQILLNYVEDEIKNGIPTDRIIIGGFSQGGATALYTAITSPYKFGGLLALSTWLPLHDRIAQLLNKSSTDKFKTPIMQFHGDIDPLVPEPWASMSGKLLQQVGFTDVKYKVYEGLMHSSTEQEMVDIKNFIDKAATNSD